MKLQDLTPLAAHLPAVEVEGLASDSRAVKPGDLFAALQGDQADGRLYVADAVARGAVAVLSLPGTSAPVPVVTDDEPRLVLARMASRLYAGQPGMIAGITGTNGKTSVARFASQLWSDLGCRAGSLGTLGAMAPGYSYALRHTTPDPVELHQVLHAMEAVETTHLAMEISSHGLAQHRADGVELSLAAFTNITRDHFDYHGTFEAYYAAKRRLWTDLLPEGKSVVINTDGPGAEQAIADARKAGRRPVTVGRKGALLRLAAVRPDGAGLRVVVETESGQSHDLRLSMVGGFQADNALVAAGLVIESGFASDEVLAGLERLSSAPGRMERVAHRRWADGEASVYVDYAHTPAAVAKALDAVRPHTAGRVHIVLGAGGDRDRAKRSEMGQAAHQGADEVIITDDNPRFEEPDRIRAQVAEGAPGAVTIADRREAIRRAIEGLEPGDSLVIAGKGHERGQSIKGVTYPFHDGEVAQGLVQAMER